MPKQFDTLAVIGRFQAPHNAHFELLERAGKLANQVVVILGSAHRPRDFKHPWTAAERMQMLAPELLKIQEFTGTKFVIECTHDTLYDYDAWVARIQTHVAKHTVPSDRIGLIGHAKDLETKEYLEMFPQWERVGIDLIEILDATQIRDMYFSEKFNPSFLTGVMRPSVVSFLMKFRETPEFAYIMAEKRVIDDRKKSYASLDYPSCAITVDAVVVQAGHILLIKRKSSPGKGLWALPGGYFNAGGWSNREKTFIKPDMTPTDGILRELSEETMIDVPQKVLRGSIRSIRDFCHPNRSLLGRSITFAAHIVLNGGEWKLPKVKGCDDAETAKWVPFIDVRREHLFDDHADIIQSFVPSIDLIM